jgi:non-canonical purine NTP pyrophosphatase (RdgB/HAM1 family)
MFKFITGNKKKVEEFNTVLAPMHVEQLDIDLAEIQELDPHKIIKHKLGEAFKHHSGEFIVEDSSMYMAALGGKLPGPLVKWFNETIGTAGLAEIAQKFHNDKANAKTIIGYAKSPDDIQFFEGNVKGRIVAPRGNYSFGYDPIFLPEGSAKTLSELKSEGDFNSSPRGIAVKKFKEYLDKK